MRGSERSGFQGLCFKDLDPRNRIEGFGVAGFELLQFTGIPSGFRLRGSGHGVAIRVLGFQFRDSGFQLRTGGLALAINGGSGEGRYFLAGPPAWEPSGRLPSDDDDGSFTLIEPTCHKQRANADSTKSEHFGA